MLPRLPSSMHAGATTPADAARCTCRFSSRTTDGLPLIQGGSASALPVSRPAQRSLHVPACMVAELLNATLLSGVLQSMSLPPRTAPAATSRKRQLLGGIRTHQENAPFHGALGISGLTWPRSSTAFPGRSPVGAGPSSLGLRDHCSGLAPLGWAVSNQLVRSLESAAVGMA